ncbi:hypothetical protein BO226_24705 (plasmid) [Rhodococcus sp. 2G]|nr:hypothetical protein BO226_24705 [Rhodococcus sp. 2G]
MVVSTMPGNDGSHTDNGQLAATRISSVKDTVHDAEHQVKDCTGTLFPGKDVPLPCGHRAVVQVTGVLE